MTVPRTSDAVDWTSIVAEHESHLRRVVARRIRIELVDDVVQETFLRAYRSRASLDADRPIGPWLTTIAIRVATDLSRPTRATLSAVPTEVLSVAGADAELATIERIALIRRALAALTPRHREILESIALDGISQVTLARREGVAPEVIRSTVLRARHRFRTVYERLAKEHGLVGAGGSIKPALASLRARVIVIEPSVPRKAQFAAAVFGLIAAGGSILSGSTPGEAQSSIRSAALHPSATSDSLERELDPASPSTSNGVIGVKSEFPGGEAGGGISSRAPLELDMFWTLHLHQVGVSVVAGTTETDGRLSAELTTYDKGLGTSAGITAHGSCEAGPDRPKACSVLDVVERTLRSAEGTIPLRDVVD